ncbi:MAG: hypothetical protein ACXVBC_13830, partial [Bdellovibrionota bacterium]
GEILSNIDLAVSDDGQLYSCASVTNGGSVSAFRISQFSSATNLWTTIATNPNGYNFTNPGDTDACRMASSGNVVYAAAVGSDSTLWVRQIQGSAVSAINFDSTSILGANHFPFSLMDIRASAQGPFIALTDLVKTTADGSTPYLGSNTYLLNSDGTSWGIVHAARAPVDTSLGKVVGITRLLISQDLRSLFATGLAASTGGVNSGNVSLWHLGN